MEKELLRQTIKAGEVEPGMFINIGFKLYKVRSVNDAGTHVDIDIQSMDPNSSKLIGALYICKEDQIHVNIDVE
jgi:hypothetical protein